MASEWSSNQTEIGTTLEESRQWDLLELTFRYEEPNSIVQSILDKSMKEEMILRSSGGFRTVDTGDNSKFELTAPDSRSDVRPVNQWFLSDYSKELVGRSGDVYDLTLELMPEKSKEFDNEYGTFTSEPTSTQNNDKWYFSFAFGDIVTANVGVDVEESPDGTLDEYSLTLILSSEEVRIVEENASYMNTVFVREIPDNDDIIEDTSNDERQTVFVSPPGSNSRPIEEGEYVIKDWITEWQSGAFEVEIVLG